MPSDDAYGRVTRPERFAVLHDVADDIVARLERDYDVERGEGRHLDPRLADRALECHRVVRLSPADRSAAPIALAWSGFPGVVARFGRWHLGAFPVCGCDACDEQPDEVADLLRTTVDDVVAGRFAESYDGVTLEHASWSTTATRRGAGGVRVAGTDLERELGEPGSVQWAPWPRR